MNPYCPKCDSSSTRRTAREKAITSRLMYFFGLYPWECLTCQKRFFSKVRYPRTTRNAAGEVYTGSKKKQKVQPGSEERHS